MNKAYPPALFLSVCGLACLLALPLASVLGSANAALSRRLGIADNDGMDQTSMKNIQQRLALFQQAGIGVILVDYGLGVAPSAVTYMQTAAAAGFKFKLPAGTFNGPPAGFFNAHPDAQIRDQYGNTSLGVISYWYPDLQSVLTTNDDAIFLSLKTANLLSSISHVIVPAGPAGEPIYPSQWPTVHPQWPMNFWWYDVHAQADFSAKMQEKYKTVAAANTAWRTKYTAWSAVRPPKPGTGSAELWNDALTWYQNAKRNFITWQVAHYKALLAKYYPSGRAPQLMLYVSGAQMLPTDWQMATTSLGVGAPYSIKQMADWLFLVDTAAQNGMQLEFPGLPAIEELAYLVAYMKTRNYSVRMWAADAWGDDMTEYANEVLANGLYGLDLIDSGFILVDLPSGAITTKQPNFTTLRQAYGWLRGVWAGKITPTLTLEGASPLLWQNQCLYVDPGQTYQFCMQGDGNLVYYRGAAGSDCPQDATNCSALWNTGTAGQDCSSGLCAAYFNKKGRGSLEVWNGSNKLWASPVTELCRSDVHLMVSEASPHVQVANCQGKVVWLESGSINKPRKARMPHPVLIAHRTSCHCQTATWQNPLSQMSRRSSGGRRYWKCGCGRRCSHLPAIPIVGSRSCGRSA